MNKSYFARVSEKGHNMRNLGNIRYTTKKCSDLTDAEIYSASELFSENYGTYSPKAPKNKGKQIKLSPSYYQRLKDQDHTYVSFAFAGKKLVGQAFYVLLNHHRDYTSWVIQLVVSTEHRNMKIATRLLRAVWGFSNDSAWGLATSNPRTIKTLEASTLRRPSFLNMQENRTIIEELGAEIDFINGREIIINDDNAYVNTDFYVDHAQIPLLIEEFNKTGSWQFGELNEGHEWVAFVFKDQPVENLNEAQIDEIFLYSEERLNEAYSRMKIEEHSWAKHAPNEIDFVEKYVENTKSKIIDFGCGQGRHTAELIQRGYSNVIGYDFSQSHIEFCKSKYPEHSDAYLCHDCRNPLSNPETIDVAIALYDVIGSFAEQNENDKIIQTIVDSLKPNGFLVLSVMNMELTETIVTNRCNVYENPQALFDLHASDTMQKTGDIFNADYILHDTKSDCIIRKEKFLNDGGLFAEYIVRDRRYRKSDIDEIASRFKLSCQEIRYVQAGRWDIPLSPTSLKAKEILVVLQKLS